jgi:Protein of unknown function (DUF4054)
MTFVFDISQFRTWYPEFADPVAFPDATLQMYYDLSLCYISDNDRSGFNALSGMCLYRAITLMTAHLTKISIKTNAGKSPTLVQAATVDKISITLTPPPVPNEWRYWLNQTPYGQAYLALLESYAAGGFMVGGLPEKSAFRKVDGIF